MASFSIKFAPLVNPWLAIVLFVAIVIYVTYKYNKDMHSLSKVYHRLLIATRYVVLILLLFFFLNPYVETKEPDNETFQLTVLCDNSESMLIRDCEGEARLDKLNALLTDKGQALYNLQQKYNCHTLSFTAHSRKSFLPLRAETGSTHIGDNLLSSSITQSLIPTGAVLLLSDGRENGGRSAAKAAMAMAQRKVPISCIGFGNDKAFNDLSVEFDNPKTTMRKGEQKELSLKIKSSFSKAVDTELSIYNDQALIYTQKIKLEANQDYQHHFKFLASREGTQYLKAKLTPLKQEQEAANNLDFLTINVKHPDKTRILYLSARPSWEYKYLKIVADRNKKISLHAIIRISSKNAVYTFGLRTPMESQPAGQSKSEEINPRPFKITTDLFKNYEVIIADLNILPLLTEEDKQNLILFTANKGGGILYTGRVPENSDSKALFKTIPVMKLTPEKARQKKPLELESFAIFAPDGEHDLSPLESVFYIPKGDTFQKPGKRKRSAKSLLLVNNLNPILAVQSYGAGRTAYLGLETWKWQMANSTVKRARNILWKRLLKWLGSPSKKRVKLLFNNKKVTVNKEVELGMDFLDSTYSPSLNGKVRLKITTPSGQKKEIPLYLTDKLDGHYHSPFTPEESGEYRFTLLAQSNQEEPLIVQGSFLAVKGGIESNNQMFNPKLLKDICRISGGKYYSYNELPDDLELPISKTVPTTMNQFYLFRTWSLLLLMVVILCLDWYLRRRVGLK